MRRLAAVALGLALARPGAARGDAPHARAVIPGAGEPRAALSAREQRLDAQLRHVLAPRAPAAGTTLIPVPGAWQRGDAVRVQVDLAPGGGTDALTHAGLAIERTAPDTAEGWVRTADLPSLADADGVRAVRPARPGRLRATADAAARADLARATGWDGTGVTVGVISDGAGTLPGSVVPAGCDPGSGAEGQAIEEVVHTLAPGATVLFASGSASSLGFIAAVQCLQAAGAHVIVDDLGFFDQPWFEDGPVARAVRAAVQAGVSYHSAAGNEAQSHYAAPFRPTAGSAYHDFATGGQADNYDEIAVAPGEQLDCALQWNDPFGGAADDYDLELYDLGTSPPALVFASTNPQTGTQDPYEDFSVVNAGQTARRAGVAIRRTSGAARVLGLFCFGGSTPQYVTAAGSVIGHPAVAEVVAVGAVNVADPGLGQVEAYSSQGPVEIYFPTRETRAKPDLVAFDGITSATRGFNPFFGTSAAAPDSAAVAALMLAKNSCRTPAQIQGALASSATDIGVPGVDSVAGAGRLDALAALEAVPPPTCSADAQCDDGDVCTTDTCAGCSCEHHPACDDGDPCTTDTCDPATGCASSPIEGFAGVACVCSRGLGAASCAGTPLPPGVRTRFTRACALVARAAAAIPATHQRRLVGRAVTLLGHARRRAAKDSSSAACASSLSAVLDDARTRAARLRVSL